MKDKNLSKFVFHNNVGVGRLELPTSASKKV